MADLPTLAVTGSTGALGGMVARLVADAGVPQRLLVRDPGRAPDLAGAVPVRCAFADVPADAIDGVEVLLMVSASESADRLDQHRAFVDAAARAGVRHLVYTSFVGAAADSVFTLGRDHYATEEHVRDLDLQHTFLRDNFYLDFLPMMVGDDGVLRGPAGEGRVAAVARADIARAAAAVLLDSDEHTGATYDLTGPEALTLGEVAQILSEETGHEVRFLDETVEEAYASRRRWEAPQWQYDAWVSTYTSIKAGEVAAVSGDVERLTGRPPTDLRDLLALGRA